MRTIVSFNEGWLFTKQGKDEPVTLPHTGAPAVTPSSSPSLR